MSHNNTPALVDLRNPENLPAVAYSLHKAIKANPGMTRQQLSDEIAKALGARSLEAYQAMSAPVTDAPVTKMQTLPDELNTMDSCKTEAEKLRDAMDASPLTQHMSKLDEILCQWCVVRQPGTRHYLTGDWANKDAPLTLDSIFSAAARKLVFLPPETARYVCDFPEKFMPGYTGTLSYTPLKEAEPELYQAFYMNSSDMYNHLTSNPTKNFSFLSLGYVGAQKRFELGKARFSLLDYAAFLVNELRCFVNNATLATPAHSDREVDACYTQLTALRNNFDKAFYEHIYNTQKGDMTHMITAIGAWVDAEKIVRKLSSCRLRFPHGLPPLPQGIHQSTDHAGAVEQLDNIRAVICQSINKAS